MYREERAAREPALVAAAERRPRRLLGGQPAHRRRPAPSPHPAGDTDLRFASAGSYLRNWYGRRYLSIGFTFDHGSVAGDPATPSTSTRRSRTGSKRPSVRYRTPRSSSTSGTAACPHRPHVVARSRHHPRAVGARIRRRRRHPRRVVRRRRPHPDGPSRQPVRGASRAIREGDRDADRRSRSAAELDGYLDPIRLRGTSADQFGWYLPLPDDQQAALIESARRASELVASLPPRRRPRHAARLRLLGWYQNFAVDTGFHGVHEHSSRTASGGDRAADRPSRRLLGGERAHQLRPAEPHLEADLGRRYVRSARGPPAPNPSALRAPISWSPTWRRHPARPLCSASTAAHRDVRRWLEHARGLRPPHDGQPPPRRSGRLRPGPACAAGRCAGVVATAAHRTPTSVAVLGVVVDRPLAVGARLQPVEVAVVAGPACRSAPAERRNISVAESARGTSVSRSPSAQAT